MAYPFHETAMPSAPLRPCSAPGCPALVRSGTCPTHTREYERIRGTATERGFTSHWHRVFKPLFQRMLLDRDIIPICGATLPDGPQTRDSQCKAQGLMTFEPLQHDHEPPLTAAERRNPRAVEDPQRIQLLCERCHSLKTRRQNPQMRRA